MLALRLLKSALVAPVCEELFFRGYLLCGLSGHGRARAAVISAACFAAVHGGNFAAYAVFGLLMGLLTLRTGSLLAPILAHACYNAALLVLSGAGLSALVTGGTILACTVQLAGCAALAAVLKRAYTARGAQGTFELWTGGRLTGREAAVLLAAAALLAGTMLGGGRL